MDLILLCCGSRFWNDKRKIEKEFDKITKEHHIVLVVQGGAKGADELCRVEAERRGIQTCTFHANWFYYRKPAGPIRNAAQLKFGLRMAIGSPKGPMYKFKVLAFHPNIAKSSGSRDMVEKARAAEMEVKVIA